MKFRTVIIGIASLSLLSTSTPKPEKTAVGDWKKDAHQQEACFSEASILEDLQRKQSQLETREKSLEEKAHELETKEKLISEQMQKLEELRQRIFKEKEFQAKDLEEKLAKIMETLESMSPKSSAQLLAQLDEGLAIMALQKIGTPRLAKILNLMDPKKSSRLTEKLAGIEPPKPQESTPTPREIRLPATSGSGGGA